MNAASLNKFIRSVKSQVETAEVKIVAYHCLPPLGAKKCAPIVNWEGFSRDQLVEYEKEGQIKVNPFINLPFARAQAVLWSEIRESKTLSPGELAFMDTYRKFLSGEGVSIPLYGPSGYNGNVCIRFMDDETPLSNQEIWQWQMVSQQTHLSVCNIIRTNQGASIKLTRREKEVLEWLVVGKSNSVIADIMGLSKHTIDSYMRKLFFKLDASDRVTAAVRGLAIGAVN